jgi:hypothetical protein
LDVSKAESQYGVKIQTAEKVVTVGDTLNGEVTDPAKVAAAGFKGTQKGDQLKPTYEGKNVFSAHLSRTSKVGRLIMVATSLAAAVCRPTRGLQVTPSNREGPPTLSAVNSGDFEMPALQAERADGKVRAPADSGLALRGKQVRVPARAAKQNHRPTVGRVQRRRYPCRARFSFPGFCHGPRPTARLARVLSRCGSETIA